MLNEYREIYKKKAMDFPLWDKLNRSELCRKYVELEQEDSVYTQACLSAIIYSFWNLATHSYYIQEKVIAEEEDCYNWLIESIMFCLDSKPWMDPKSSLFKDPNGPEKAINVCFSNVKINFFVAAKRQKRVLNYNKLSLEALQEDSSDAYFMPVYDNDSVKSSLFYDKIVEYYSKKDYLRAFILDSIIDYDFIDRFEENGCPMCQFSYKKLKHHLRNIDDRYCKLFSNKYNIDFENVKKASKYVTDLSYDRMTRGVTLFFKTLSTDKEFLEDLC